MDNKIQELAQKIYQDGVEKANAEALSIVKNAEKKRDELLAAAKAEAEKILSSARAEAKVTKEQTESDLKNVISNASDALQTSITNMVNSAAITKGVDAAFSNPESLFAIVVEMSKQMFASDANGVEISSSDASKLEEYFRKEAKDILDKGVKIKEVAGKSASFDIAPEGADYKVNISKESFAEYFKSFMRPRMQEILFGGNK